LIKGIIQKFLRRTNSGGIFLRSSCTNLYVHNISVKLKSRLRGYVLVWLL